MDLHEGSAFERRNIYSKSPVRANTTTHFWFIFSHANFFCLPKMNVHAIPLYKDSPRDAFGKCTKLSAPTNALPHGTEAGVWEIAGIPGEND